MSIALGAGRSPCSPLRCPIFSFPPLWKGSKAAVSRVMQDLHSRLSMVPRQRKCLGTAPGLATAHRAALRDLCMLHPGP